MKVKLYSQDGSVAGDVEVSDAVFGRKVNKNLIHKILTLQLNNTRAPIAHTLTKGEVRGGGKKPHKQKHTGWARTGSSRNPHWKGGGVALGPRSNRNYVVKASVAERRGALLSALSGKMKDGSISALSAFTSKGPKTKAFAEMLSKLPFKKKILFVLPEKDVTLVKSARNIPKMKTILVNYLNIADLLSYNDVVFLKDALPLVEKIFAK